jgi:hypothetical protein
MRERHRTSRCEDAIRDGIGIGARWISDSALMDLRGPPDARGAVHREQGEVRSMAGPGFVVVVALMLVCVPLWALIWGQKERRPQNR